MSGRIALSVLMLSIPERKDMMNRLVQDLSSQMDPFPDAELLVLVDNKRRSMGEKRNWIQDAAKGEYSTIVDDDDEVSRDYVGELMQAIAGAGGADCIVFDTDLYRQGRKIADVRWGVDLTYEDDWDNGYLTRPVMQWMAVRSEIRRKHPYPDRNSGIDIRQQRKMKADIKTEYRIERCLYHQNYDPGQYFHRVEQARGQVHGVA